MASRVCGSVFALLPLLVGGVVLRAQTDWTQIATMQGRIGAAMAYDVARDRMVLFGGQPVAGQQLAETWEHDGIAWSRRATAVSPGNRSHHMMAHDPVRGVTVLFGGFRLAPFISYLADTWEWNGTTWTQRTPLHTPPARSRASLVWDSTSNRMLLFGGFAGGARNDLWSWDGTDWTQLPVAAGPSSRSEHAAEWDPVRQRLVVYGGYDSATSGNPLADTWEWDGTSWFQAAPVTSPPPLRNATLTFRGSSGRPLLFGGGNMLGLQNGTWEWDGTNWTQLPTGANPVGRELHTAGYDSVRQQVRVFGGWINGGLAIQSQLWAFDPSGSWNLVPDPNGAIVGRLAAAVAADDVAGSVLLFGGLTTLQTLGDTWMYTGSGWTQLQPATSPSPRGGHAMATDPVSGRPILSSGGWNTGSGIGDLWRWSGTTWQVVSQTNAPPPRYLHSLCAHPPSNTILMFGGQDFSTMLDDTWRWDAVTGVWTQLQPAQRPSPRGRHGMVYDAARDRIVLFGGFGPLNDTWEWNGTNWLFVSTPVSPPARTFPALAWDAERARVVLFGGAGAGSLLGDTWEWDGVVWMPRVFASSPAASGSPYLAWSGPRSRSVAVVGAATWEYGAVQPATWSSFGTGCASAVGTPLLTPAPWSRPWLGDTFRIHIEPVPPGQLALVIFGDRLLFGSLPLPAALASFGMPGCWLLVGDHGPLLAPTTGSIAEVQVVIPNVPALVGAVVDVQGWVTDPVVNAAGWVTTNGGSLRAGMR